MNRIRKTFLALTALLVAPVAANAELMTLDFETAAPCTFNATAPLTSLGDVTFTGVDGNGGVHQNLSGKV